MTLKEYKPGTTFPGVIGHMTHVSKPARFKAMMARQ